MKTVKWWWLGALAVLIVGGLVAYATIGPGQRANENTSTTASASSSQPEKAGAPPAAKPSGGAASTSNLSETPSTEQVTVVPDGATLATVTAPPPSTLAQIKYSQARDGQLYDVTIRPYGTGPARAGHGTVVVTVDSSKAEKSYDDPVDLAGTNALLELGPKALGIVTVGGTYSGVVRLLRRGDVLVLELVSVEPQ